MKGLRCPDCGSERITLTPEGLLVCSECGRVLGVMLEDRVAVRNLKMRVTRSPMRQWRVYPNNRKTLRAPPKKVNLRIERADPLDEIIARRLRRSIGLSTRKSATLLALARFIVLTARKYPMKKALAEASHRYGVSARLLSSLVRRYRGLIADLQGWVVEEWRRTYRQARDM